MPLNFSINQDFLSDQHPPTTHLPRPFPAQSGERIENSFVVCREPPMGSNIASLDPYTGTLPPYKPVSRPRLSSAESPSVIKERKGRKSKSSSASEQIYCTANYITLNSNDYELALTSKTDLYSSVKSHKSTELQSQLQFKNEKRLTKAIYLVCCLL